MAIEYPDVIGEYIDAPQRYEVNGLQFVGTFEPAQLPEGGTTNFVLFLQNALNETIQAQFKLDIPQSGRFRGQPLLATKETEISLELAQAEVGRLIIPFANGEKFVAGAHTLGIECKVSAPRGAGRARKAKQTSQIKTPLLDDLVGLDLVSVLGATYSTQGAKKVEFELTLTAGPADDEAESTPSDLSWNYTKIWTVDFIDSLRQARENVNEARVHILDDLQVEPLFAALYAENTERFADSGQPLRVGEAVVLGKLLTYTCHFFLEQGPLQDGLLCPIWERAMVNDLPTANSINVMKYAGYRHILRLAIALSFGLVAETVGRQPWSKEERRGVIAFLADSLEDGSPVPIDLLYLPLMLGAVRIATRVRLPGEDLSQTLNLVKVAREARTDLFTDPDTEMAGQIFDRLLERAIAKVNG